MVADFKLHFLNRVRCHEFANQIFIKIQIIIFYLKKTNFLLTVSQKLINISLLHVYSEAYAIGKKERPPFLPQKQPKSESEDDPVPDELLCLICRDLLDDAVVIHCCRNSYCDDCIRTTLLDSDDHVCPTCGQSSVSPDSLTANKFLRQAVNNFKKERVGGNSLRKKPAITTPQNLTPLPGPALPPLTLKKLLQPQHMQQDSQLNHQTASKRPSCRASDVVLPVATDLAGGSGSSKSSLSAQSLLTARIETEGKMHNNSSTVSLDKEPVDSLSKLVSEVSQTQVSEVKEKLSSSDPVVGLSGSSSTWDGNTLSSTCTSSGSLTESNSQQPRNSHSSLSSSPSFSFLSPFCPNSLINTPIPTGQLNSTYQPTLTTWTLPPGDAPSSAPIPKKWYGYHKNDRDRDSPSHFKPKTSHSYGLSSTHSRSSHRDLHPQSYPSTYSFGYKRPPSSTSSSSSPRCGHHSRCNSSSHHQKNRCHTRHSHKGSALRNLSSRRHGKCARKEAAGPSRAYADTPNGPLELDLQLYLQWRKEFQAWYDKSYTHFHQMLLPPPPLPPHPQDSHSSGRNSNRTNDHSPLSEHSSFSRSPSSQSSTDSCSTTSRSSSDISSDKANEGHSPPSWTSSGGRRTTSEDKSQLRELPESCTEKSKEIYLHKTIGKQQLSPQTQNQKEENVFQRRVRDGASSPASADFLDQSREENQTETTTRNPSDSVQPLTKLEKSLDREQERKSKEEKGLERNQSRKRESRELTSRECEEKKQRTNSHTQLGKTETGRAEHKKIMRKRKDSESLERSDTVGPQNSTFQKNAENPESNRKKSPSRKKQKMEKMSSTEKDIWEGGMKVIPQKKISININLEGKMKERNDREKSASFNMNCKEKTVETNEREKNQYGERSEKTVDKLIDSNQEETAKEKIKSDEKEAVVTDYKKEECWKNSDKEEQNDTEKEYLELWHCTLSTAGEDDGTIRKEVEGVGDQGGAQKVSTEQKRKTDSRCREAAKKFSSKSLHHGQKKSPDNGSSFSVGGSCGEEGSLERRTTEKMEEEKVQDRDEARQSEQIPCDEERKNEEKHGQITASSSSPTVVPSDLSEPKNSTEMEEHSKRQGQPSSERGRDKDLAPSRGTKSSLSANRDIERRERCRRENYAQQETKRLKQETREEEGRKFTSVQKRNLPSPLLQEAERNDQQHHRGGYSSRKTSCSSREKESTSVGEVSGLPYHGVSKTQRDYSVRRSSYHPASSVNQRDKEKPARSHLSPPSLFYNHFDSSGSLHRGTNWPPKSRNERGECRSDGSQSARKEQRSRRDEEEQKQRPSRGSSGGGNARSSDSSRGKLKNHRKEMSHNCRSSQLRKMQM
uniref:RING-type domain-containing protein n=1 Tax=Oryzias latipes TaxID=8090 RepID=A0A3B3HTB3_ORYLA